MPNHDSAASRILRTMSLDALRGFEAAARHLSFTAAAEELALTQSAVSKQVKMLEESIGRTVFVRGSRKLSLTPVGHRLHQGVQHTLRHLESAIEEIVQRDRECVSITVTPSFASLWLVPRLGAYRLLDPAVDVQIHASDLHVDLERAGLDLAIRLGRPEDMPNTWKPLARERLMLVASPALADRVRVPADLPGLPHLVFHHPVERFPGMSWSSWYERLDLTKAASQPVFQFSRYEHVVAAAVDGVGVAIGRAPLLLPMLRLGQLRVVLPQTSSEGLLYRLVRAEGVQNRPEVLRFAAWIEGMLAADDRA